jgi:hypothetical protein
MQSAIAAFSVTIAAVLSLKLLPRGHESDHRGDMPVLGARNVAAAVAVGAGWLMGWASGGLVVGPLSKALAWDFSEVQLPAACGVTGVLCACVASSVAVRRTDSLSSSAGVSVLLGLTLFLWSTGAGEMMGVVPSALVASVGSLALGIVALGWSASLNVDPQLLK